MKVVCDRGALVDSLNLVNAVVVSRTPKPSLSCVKITTGESALELAATDLEVTLRITTAKVDINEAGEALLPADKLNQIVRESVDSTVTLETDEEAAHIRGQDSHFKVFGYDPSDFPPVPETSDEPAFEISAGELHQLIGQTIFATARENSRYAINGVLIERDGKKLTMVATDGRRLAKAKGTCKAGKSSGDAVSKAIVPTKALTLIQRLFDEPDKMVTVTVADNQIHFATDEALLVSNLVEGNFPPYKDVIPRDGDKKATMNTEVLSSAVRRAALLTNEESKGVRLAFDSEGLTLSSRAPEMGEAEIKVQLPGYDGDPVEIGFNPVFILDALKVVSVDQVTMDLKAPNKPGVLSTGPDFLYVVMPVNLQ